MEDSKRGETEQPTLMDTSTADNGAGSSAQESSGSNVNRVVLSRDELGSVGADRLRQLWWEQDRYLDQLEMRLHEATAAAESNKARADAGKREQLLVMRLSTKEQELQELAAQIAELKSAQAPSTGQLKATLVDPGVNLIIQKLKKELDDTKKKMQETQEELSAWKFTPDSATGKRLMAKCRQLLQENEDIGKMISSGRLAKLEGELAMQKALCDEMKKNQEEMDDFVQELDEDVEGMQSTIFFLQQQLKEAKETISSYQAAEKKATEQDIKTECVDEKRDVMESKEQPDTDDVADPAKMEEDDCVNQDSMEQHELEEAVSPSEHLDAGVIDENSQTDDMTDKKASSETSSPPSTRGRATRARNSANSPSSPKESPRRGRSARGRKRNASVEDDASAAAPATPTKKARKSPGRPKRKCRTTTSTKDPESKIEEDEEVEQATEEEI